MDPELMKVKEPKKQNKKLRIITSTYLRFGGFVLEAERERIWVYIYKIQENNKRTKERRSGWWILRLRVDSCIVLCTIPMMGCDPDKFRGWKRPSTPAIRLSLSFPSYRCFVFVLQIGSSWLRLLILLENLFFHSALCKSFSCIWNRLYAAT